MLLAPIALRVGHAKGTPEVHGKMHLRKYFAVSRLGW